MREMVVRPLTALEDWLSWWASDLKQNYSINTYKQQAAAMGPGGRWGPIRLRQIKLEHVKII